MIILNNNFNRYIVTDGRVERGEEGEEKSQDWKD